MTNKKRQIMNRPITTDSFNIIDLIYVSEEYGFEDDVFLDAMFNLLDYNLTDEEIEAFAAQYLTDEYKAKGYGEEDYEDIKERLKELAKKYNDKSA